MDSTWAYEMNMLIAPKPFWSLDALTYGHKLIPDAKSESGSSY